MNEISAEISRDPKVTNLRESPEEFTENDPSDYESINSDTEDNYRKDHNSDYESDTLQNIERQEGDGQESVPPKKVDDDEDKKNPQYIPKRGTFYEHDDRTLDEEVDEGTGVDKKERQSKKSIWIEKKERWGHDRFNENEQAPKSRSELIGIYGYDIRNEDGPPRARRRRRYGRGPNKYTRTWEDEDAYKPAKPVKVISKKSKKPDDFSPLEPEIDSNEKEDTTEENDSEPIEIESKVLNGMSNDVSKPIEIAQKIEKIIPEQSEIISTVKIQQKEIKPADYRGFTKARQYKNSQIEQKIIKKQEKVHVMTNIEENLANLSITKKQNRQNSVPPRLQNEQKGPKRYSSLRQRSLPETAAATTFSQQTFYANDYTPPQPQQAILSQPPPPTVLQQIPPTIQQVPVTATALLPTPTQFAPPFPPTPTFIPAPVVPASPFISPQTQIINFVATPPQFTQAQFPGFQHQQFNAVTPPAELNYQCQGGTTYYSTQSQQLGHAPLQRRPKAAIPIVPPPPQQPQIRDITNTNSDVFLSGTENNKQYDDFYENDYDDANIVVQ